MQENDKDVLIDSIKLCYDHFDNVRSPILKDQKNIFNVFYENDLKYRQINKYIALMETNHGKEVDSLRKTDYEKYLKEFKKRIRAVRLEVQEQERFDLMLHRGNRYRQTVDFQIWNILFSIEKISIKIACTIFQFTIQYYEEKKIVPKTSVQIDLTKSFNQLTDDEMKLVESLSYSESHLNQADIERALQILEPFKAKYNYEPDFEIMDKLRGVDFVSTTAKNNQAEENETKEVKDEVTGRDCIEFDNLFPSVKAKNKVWGYMKTLNIIDDDSNISIGTRQNYLLAFIRVMRKHLFINNLGDRPLSEIFNLKLKGERRRINRFSDIDVVSIVATLNRIEEKNAPSFTI